MGCATEEAYHHGKLAVELRFDELVDGGFGEPAAGEGGGGGKDVLQVL